MAITPSKVASSKGSAWASHCCGACGIALDSLKVTGIVRVQLHKANARVMGCESPYSMFHADVAAYGATVSFAKCCSNQ